MEIKILFNDKAINNNFSIGWGLSLLIGEHILFDTGEKGDYLIRNIREMGIDLYQIGSIVISHDHWDHTGGLWGLLKQRRGVRVFACPHFSPEFMKRVRDFGGNLIEVKGFLEVVKNVFVTGEIEGTYKGMFLPEQAVVIKTEKGLTVITGCAHPGILKILDAVKERFADEKLYLIFGGFHLKDSDKRLINMIAERMKEMDIEKVGPMHCTGEDAEAIFKKIYNDNSISIKAGQTITV